MDAVPSRHQSTMPADGEQRRRRPKLRRALDLPANRERRQRVAKALASIAVPSDAATQKYVIGAVSTGITGTQRPPHRNVRLISVPKCLRRRRMKNFLIIIFLLACEAVGGRALADATFVGSETCANCHRAEADLWRRSQHKRAMDHATEKSVLGDFNDAQFDYFGVHSRFFRKNAK